MNTDAWGIQGEYEDAFRKRRKSPQSTIEAIRREINVEEDELRRPRAIVIRRGEMLKVDPGEVMLEDGASIRVGEMLPSDLPLGYHELRSRGSPHSMRLIVSPGVCSLPARSRQWAWAVQLYATRSSKSWGIGDLADLRELARWSNELGAALVMINPLHAAAPVLSQEPSPYFPSSRCFRNPIYLRIEEIAGAGEAGLNLDELASAARALNGARLIDRDEAYRLKRAAFERIYDCFSGDPAFDAYQQQMGDSLTTYATFCVLAEQHGRDYRRWPAEFQHPQTTAVGALREQRAERVRFHAWLQWLVEQQLQKAARDLPIMQDLAVGFDPGGADAWMWQDLLARNMSVGAPPDLHNPWGQDWELPPFNPHKLAAAGFEPFVQTIRAALRHAGGLRIDHAAGLFRLFWIPDGAKPIDGAYVNYPAKALLDIVALESHRAGAFIVAEDLGTVEESMREELMKHQMLSYRLVYLEHARPVTYPERSMAAVTTHDLPTIAGLWTGSDFRSQESMGLKPNRETAEEVVARISQMAGLAAGAPLPEVVMAVHRLLAESNSMIIAATLEDALLMEKRPNMPGTTDQWPNWRIPLPATIEEIERRSLPREIAAILGE